MSDEAKKPATVGAPPPVLVDVERLRDALRVVVRGEWAGLRAHEMRELVAALELSDGAVAEILHEERMRWAARPRRVL